MVLKQTNLLIINKTLTTDDLQPLKYSNEAEQLRMKDTYKWVTS